MGADRVDVQAGRRRFLQAAAALGLAGCSSSPTNSPTMDALISALHRPQRTADDYPLSREQIDQLPYAALGLRIGEQPRAILILATVQGSDLTWVSADRVQIVIRDGRIVRTQGLRRDLSEVHLVQDDVLWAVAADGRSRTALNTRSLHHDDESEVHAVSELRSERVETIDILGTLRRTVLIREQLTIPQWRWATENHYWVDVQQRTVWRARQRFCPELPMFETERFSLIRT